MSSRHLAHLACAILWLLAAEASPGELRVAAPTFSLRLEPHHPWRPPFGLDRVGHSRDLVASAAERPQVGDYALVLLAHDKEVHREPLNWPETPPYSARLSLDRSAEEAVIVRTSDTPGRGSEVARLKLDRLVFEAEAVARAAPLINPVDLGTILVPSDWLLLGPGQEGIVEVAALDQGGRPDAKLSAWFESSPRQSASSPFPLTAGHVKRRQLKVPTSTSPAERDVLHVSLADGQGSRLWQKAIPVMRVLQAPRWPRFGASYSMLRYDAPISVRDPSTGRFSSLEYGQGWRPDLRDVVVSLPDGSRFVFWRGSSYIPFWATPHNTGACYEWAEMLSRPQDAVDCVEPLMDKELRYGRVEILESTPACVRVRWTYQSTDLHYQVWGDSAVEEYTFYPDGFGVRALSLKTTPGARYELSEFIILTPQATYPLAVLPDLLAEAIGQDGKKSVFQFPFAAGKDDPRKSLKTPAIYRLHPHKDESRTAIYFNPQETQPPPIVFEAFRDRGQLVTPCYWGSHWPLARGNATGWAIDDRVARSPCHNSVMSWAHASPTPLRSAEFASIDALGRSRPMAVRQWAWLIGMSDAPDARLLQWARSFASPPALEIQGGTLDQETYVPERRAIRLRVEGRALALLLKPQPVCVNPVFELAGASAGPVDIRIDGARLEPARFAWDGRRLWIDATLEKPARIDLEFAGPPRPDPEPPRGGTP
jgi:hypothetical protein